MPESFFDTFVETSGSFVNSDEKIALAEAGIPIPVLAVAERDGKFGEEYALQVEVTDPATGDVEERQMTFKIGTVQSRDRMLAAMQEWFKNGGAPVSVKLEKVGQSWILRKAE